MCPEVPPATLETENLDGTYGNLFPPANPTYISSGSTLTVACKADSVNDPSTGIINCQNTGTFPALPISCTGRADH